jgi:L-seryl-tRNA(Ser) seleniumtransferase
MSKPVNAKNALRILPSVDQLLRTATGMNLRKSLGVSRLTVLARTVTDQMRSQILAREISNGDTRENFLRKAEQWLMAEGLRERKAGIRRVINATGVILHTNLGRAPLSSAAREAVSEEAAGYCTLEYDVNSGTRGRRGARVEELLVELTGAEDALVVNNCAASALLILRVLAGDGETLVSRGELVEIGGDFRVPDVMLNSGTHMIEVGTTNRTHLEDYRRAITERTRLIMRVHPSNYRIVGFASSPSLLELAELAHDNNLILFEDAGSGVLRDLDQYELGDEPKIGDCISQGADVVSFSGDKLLGATQAGLIVGRREIVDRLRRHSLYRALRVDKLTFAALESTLEAHRRGTALQEVPVLHMLSMSKAEIASRAQKLVEALSGNSPVAELILEIQDGESAVGGGSGPATHPPTVLIALQHPRLAADEIQSHLRQSDPPIIARIAEGKVLLDLRTVAPSDEAELLDSIRRLPVKTDSSPP